jgi:hypothetical protein
MARACGVEPGITADRARTLCPAANLRLRDKTMEEAAWEEVLLSLYQITPFLEGGNPPFVFFRPDDVPLFRELSAGLKIQMGIGPDRPMAQLAALRAARGNTLILQKSVVGDFLARFPVERLVELGFDEDLLEQLRLFGYPSLDRVKTLSRRHLSAQFGEEGERLHALLHPGESLPIPMYRPPRVIQVEFDFEHPCREPAELLPVLEHLVGQAATLLRSERCRRLAVTAQEYRSGGNFIASRILSMPLGSARSLMNVASPLLQRMLSASLDIGVLSLELGSLHRPDSLQTALFRERPSVRKAVRSVHRKFPGIIRQAVVREDVLFSEDEMRLEPICYEEPP